MRKLAVLTVLILATLLGNLGTKAAQAHVPKPVTAKMPIEQQYNRLKVNVQHSASVYYFYLRNKNRIHFSSRAKRSAWIHHQMYRWQMKRLRAVEAQLSSPIYAIRRVFGEYWQQAVAVAMCESRLSVWASNGQYLGLFQMGSSERTLYGHGSTPLAQAKAAHRYFVASGHNWSPWQCKPW